MDSLVCKSLLPSCGSCFRNRLHFEPDLLAETCPRFTTWSTEVRFPKCCKNGTDKAEIPSSQLHLHGRGPQSPTGQLGVGMMPAECGLTPEVCFGISGSFLPRNQQAPNQTHLCVSSPEPNLPSSPGLASHGYKERGKGGSEGFRGPGVA